MDCGWKEEKGGGYDDWRVNGERKEEERMTLKTT